MANYAKPGKKGDNLENYPGGDMSSATPRYKNLEEFKAEFGSYRVNAKTDNLCGPEDNYPKAPVKNDPYTNQEKGAY